VRLHTDTPTRSQIEQLLRSRNESSVSMYVPTNPASSGEAERIEFKNLAAEAVRQLEAGQGSRSDVVEIGEMLDDVFEDDEFWRYQARSLALFATPEALVTFRLPNHLVGLVEVSDRFHLKPLLRAVTFPQVAFVLALAQGSVRLLEVVADLKPWKVDIDGMPGSVADSAGKSSVRDRAPTRRIQGAEGRKVRLHQYARQIDQALRPLLTGLDVPLILAAAEPLDGIYRSVNTYPHLAGEVIAGNPEAIADAELVARARQVLDRLYAAELSSVRELFETRQTEGRGTTDIATVARAATYGAVDTVLVDIDEVVPGFVDEETGAVTFGEVDDAIAYGVVDEISRRVWVTGGRVLAVRRDDIPEQASLAAILRYEI
jgi:Bacterial archaeo-eukaryotic release factor family 11